MVQVVPLAEVWIVKAVAYAASQLSTTRLIVAVPPRSTWSHCGSLNALDQRVPALPSTAAEAGVPAFSVEEAVAGRPCEISGSAACGGHRGDHQEAGEKCEHGAAERGQAPSSAGQDPTHVGLLYVGRDVKRALSSAPL